MHRDILLKLRNSFGRKLYILYIVLAALVVSAAIVPTTFRLNNGRIIIGTEDQLCILLPRKPFNQ